MSRPIFLHSLVQGSPEWHEWRDGGIGGSDVSAILGISPYGMSRSALLRQKALRQRPLANFAMNRGSRLEPIIRGMYESLMLGSLFPPVCVQDGIYPWARVSLDGYSASLNRIAELKALKWEVHSSILAGIVPDCYDCQVQYQMFVSGVFCTAFVNYSENQRFAEHDRLAVVTVVANWDRQWEIFHEVEKFWREVEYYRENPSELPPVEEVQLVKEKKPRRGRAKKPQGGGVVCLERQPEEVPQDAQGGRACPVEVPHPLGGSDGGPRDGSREAAPDAAVERLDAAGDEWSRTAHYRQLSTAELMGSCHL